MKALSPYKNPDLSISERIADLLGQMTVAEKVGQMLQLDAQNNVADLIENVHVGSILHTSPADMVLAAEVVSRTRLQIPLLTADDCIHGHSFWPGATIFPTQLSMASSWDPDLVEKVARVTAIEVAATGLHWTFSPVLCISRDLRWGRVGETFGEDPKLIGDLGVAMVQGYQGEGLNDTTAILACAKHFVGYSETQGGRDATEADLSPRKLRSWFLPPFERAAQAGCRTFMLGYQSIDGVPITTNEWLLTDVLRGEWNFTGTLVTDWDNVGRMVWGQKIQPDQAHAAAAAVKAGNDLVMATPVFFEGAQEAVRTGLLLESDLDKAVSRILRLKFEMGLFENPRLPDSDTQRKVIGIAEHGAINLDIARKSITLLKNEGVLPLSKAIRKIAVVGPNADDQHSQLGDWAGASGQVAWMKDGN
ncbi:MAG: glycoside hydrolase family 3 N-terminal domain-containing protein, partial [Actinomycetes bacterium]